MCGRGGGLGNIDRRRLASALIKRRNVHHSQEEGANNGWGVGRKAGKGGSADIYLTLLSRVGMLGSEQVIAIVM